MKVYNHAFTFAFSAVTSYPCDSDDESAWPDARIIRDQLMSRLRSMSDTEFLENIGMPFDTYVIADFSSKEDSNGKAQNC